MPRTYSTTAATAHQLQARVRDLFGGTPLDGLVGHFQYFIEALTHCEGSQRDTGLASIGKTIEFYAALFGTSFRERFQVDSWLISDLAAQWSVSGARLSKTIIPAYAQQWSYSLLPLVGDANRAPLEIYVITFKGHDDLSTAKLLDYSWLAHELGHHLLAKAGANYSQEVLAELGLFTTSLTRKSLADSGELRVKTRQLVESLRTYWTPTVNTNDWAHEIAVDVIALWTCGPAFLAAMQDVLEQDGVDPYEITLGHPPYEVRAKVLVEVSEALGWEQEARPIESLLEKWKQSTNATRRTNAYLTLTADTLSGACGGLALRACKAWGLPQCTAALVSRVTKKYEQEASFDTATELILAAWLAYERSRDRYPGWEAQVLKRLAEEIKP